MLLVAGCVKGCTPTKLMIAYKGTGTAKQNMQSGAIRAALKAGIGIGVY